MTLKKFTAFATPVSVQIGFMTFSTPFWEHVFIVAEDGTEWRCHGRGANDVTTDPPTTVREICSGDGSIEQAKCLGQADGEAGIEYGINGLCHQMANRILHPANQLVSGALGYNETTWVYGVYGTDFFAGQYSPLANPWPELTDCDVNHNH